MKKSAPIKAQAGTNISNCHIQMEPFEFNEHMAAAVRSVAEACAANARALEVVAQRLAGPPNYSTGISIKGVE